MYYTEVRRLEQIEQERALKAQELSEKQVFEASICCMLIVLLTLLVGFFS